jgi:hypothetical protein
VFSPSYLVAPRARVISPGLCTQLETRASPSWPRYSRFSPSLAAPAPQPVIVDTWILAATEPVGAEPVTAAGPVADAGAGGYVGTSRIEGFGDGLD